MSDLPRPVTNQDFYMVAILDELRQIKSLLAPQAEPELTELREPALIGTPLPDDFPGRDKLMAAGIFFLEGVPRDGDALVAIEGIGTVTAGRIMVYLAS